MRERENSDDWQSARERGAGLWRIFFVLYCYKILGRRATKCIAFLLFCCAFPWLKSPRKHSRNFLDKIAKKKGVPASDFSTFRHLLTFVFALVDKLAGWAGTIKMDKLEIKTDDGWREIRRVLLTENRGAFVVCSHLGNIELFRAAFLNDAISRRIRINIIIATEISARFAAAMRAINEHAGDNLLSVHALGLDTAMLIEEKIAAGEVVIMAGDRVLGRVTKNSATSLDFLGVPANFPNGVFRFAAALNCAVFGIWTFPRNDGNGAELYFYQLSEDSENSENSECSEISENRVPAESPHARASVLQKRFVELLEKLTLEHPYQWFNFFKFWPND